MIVFMLDCNEFILGRLLFRLAQLYLINCRLLCFDLSFALIGTLMRPGSGCHVFRICDVNFHILHLINIGFMRFVPVSHSGLRRKISCFIATIIFLVQWLASYQILHHMPPEARVLDLYLILFEEYHSKASAKSPQCYISVAELNRKLKLLHLTSPRFYLYLLPIHRICSLTFTRALLVDFVPCQGDGTLV